ncbi:MAG: hypothetical protein HZB51_29070 [Chloroflexi bacterium]|nr:hypothetical protein [Chloroflexota bacterium]
MKKKIHLTEHIPGLDDYELKPHYDFDYSKAKPNRFAGRVILTRGGKRTNGERKLASPPTVRKTITLTRPQLAYLRKLDDNLSRAIGKLIDAAK